MTERKPRSAAQRAASAKGRAAQKAKADKVTRLEKGVMLVAITETGNISEACRRAEIERHTHYVWMERDQDYAMQFRQAEETATDRLEAEARRRALEGTAEPVYQGGKLVGTIQRYSDTLLIFLLKGHRPTKYKDRVSMEIDITKIAGEIAEANGLDPAELIAEAEAHLHSARVGRG